MGHDIQIKYEFPKVIDRVGRRAGRLRTDYGGWPLETATEVMDMTRASTRSPEMCRTYPAQDSIHDQARIPHVPYRSHHG